MKALFLITIFSFITFTISNAQLTKDEKKQLKKDLKSLSPEEYSVLVNKVSNCETDIIVLQTENETVEEENSNLEAKILRLEILLDQKDSTSSGQAKSESNYSANYEQVTPKGVIYKVQIGAFKKMDLSKYFDNHLNFSGEIEEGGIIKYTLGQFTVYWEADQFKKYLRKMGVKGAWVVAYKNGHRVDIRDALEGAI